MSQVHQQIKPIDENAKRKLDERHARKKAARLQAQKSPQDIINRLSLENKRLRKKLYQLKRDRKSIALSEKNMQPQQQPSCHCNCKCNQVSNICYSCNSHPCICDKKCPACNQYNCQCKSYCLKCKKYTCICKSTCSKCKLSPCGCKKPCYRCNSNPCECIFLCDSCKDH